MSWIDDAKNKAAKASEDLQQRNLEAKKNLLEKQEQIKFDREIRTQQLIPEFERHAFKYKIMIDELIDCVREEGLIVTGPQIIVSWRGDFPVVYRDPIYKDWSDYRESGTDLVGYDRGVISIQWKITEPSTLLSFYITLSLISSFGTKKVYDGLFKYHFEVDDSKIVDYKPYISLDKQSKHSNIAFLFLEGIFVKSLPGYEKGTYEYNHFASQFYICTSYKSQLDLITTEVISQEIKHWLVEIFSK